MDRTQKRELGRTHVHVVVLGLCARVKIPILENMQLLIVTSKTFLIENGVSILA